MLLEKSGTSARTERISNAACGCKMTSLITAMHEARAHHGTGDDAAFAIAALYRFVDLDDHRALQPVLQKLCDAADIQGTLLLAEEGINGTICGTVAGMQTVLQWLEDDARFDGLSIKFSFAAEQAFLRMKVRLKREIVTMGCPEIRPAQATGTYVEPADWDALIDDPDVMVIDTRNRYETAIGSFRGAVDPETDSFREFPGWAAELAGRHDTSRPRKLAMFCTGGIRCEKASALMQSHGFDEVYHLKGGILKYLEEIPQEDSSWQGECFVFDGRVAVDHGLQPGQYDMCHACRMPLAPQDLSHRDYAPGVSCHHCRDGQDQQQRARFMERQKQVRLAAERGEAHIGAAARDSRNPKDK